jgi:hypothetical protein
MGRVAGGVYVLLIFVFAIYGTWWGDHAYRGFAYNFGQSLIWPAILIPALGKAIGVLVLLGVIGFLTLGRK